MLLKLFSPFQKACVQLSCKLNVALGQFKLDQEPQESPQESFFITPEITLNPYPGFLNLNNMLVHENVFALKETKSLCGRRNIHMCSLLQNITTPCFTSLATFMKRQSVFATFD